MRMEIIRRDDHKIIPRSGSVLFVSYKNPLWNRAFPYCK